MGAISQKSDGWIEGAFGILPNGRLERWGIPVNIVFRSPVIPHGKTRACDDCNQARVNEFCQITTPISLPNWDHVAECARRVALSHVDWDFAVSDQFAAYKCAPILPDRIKYCDIAIWDPYLNKYRAFKPLTQLFGATAAVLNYNVSSGIIASLATRISAIPAIGYFDYFGPIAPSRVSKLALRIFDEFCEILGLKMKSDNSRCGVT